MRAIRMEQSIPRVATVKALRPIWPGVVFSRLSSTRVEHVPDPRLPGPRWIRVRNRLSGICASDLALLLADADPRIGPAALPGNDDFYLGHEAVGTVAEIGPQVSAVSLGQRVIMDALYSAPNCVNRGIDPPCSACARGHYTLCELAPAEGQKQGAGGGWSDSFVTHETDVYRVPDDLSDEQAVLIEPLSVSVRSAMRRLPLAGEKALVIGCGVIGLGVIQAVKALSPDAEVYAIARHDHQARAAREFGANEVITDEDSYRAAARVTGARLYETPFGSRMLLGGFDVVYDCVGNARTLEDSLRWARAGGAVVMTGIKLHRLSLDLNPIWYSEVDLVGVSGHGSESLNGAPITTYDLTVDLLRRGHLHAEGLITHRFALADWQRAVRTALDKRTGAIKVVFDFDSEPGVSAKRDENTQGDRC